MNVVVPSAPLNAKLVFMRLLCFVLLSVLIPSLSVAQVDTSKLYELPTVTLRVPRLSGNLLGQPMAITSIERSAIFAAQQQLSINEYLNEVPGLFALNPGNFAQDLRISIRGFGSRAAFGIRGVKILVDGVPETTPDGQGQTDNLDLGIVDRIEILRGPSSGLFGNASGGVLSIATEDKVTTPFFEAGATFGDFKMQQYQVKAGFKSGRTHYIIHGTDTETDGYRQNSGMKSTTVNAQAMHEFAENSTFKVLVNYTDSPQADDPGGINADAVMADRRQARDRNVDFQAGEAIDQFKIAAILKHSKVNTNIFYSNRNFYGLLPFENGGIIDLKRDYWGHSFQYNLVDFDPAKKDEFGHKLQVGYSFAQQDDQRERFLNQMGTQGASTFNQLESFSNLGVYLLEELQLTNGWSAMVSLRYDWNKLQAEDSFLSNGDDSGEISLSAFNPSLGINYLISPGTHFYTQYSTSFETPTLNELSNNPSGQGGFNDELSPQKARNIEVGLKGILNGKLQYDLAYFFIRTQDEIVSFELEDFPGRDFFRNAGETVRNGLESQIKYAFAKNWRFNVAYTYSDFYYDTYVTGGDDLSGTQLPGIPKHFGSASLRYIDPNGFFARLQTRMVGETFVADGNSVDSEPQYTVVNLNLGYKVKFGDWSIVPFFGINNITDEEYSDNLRINAFGRRFFEPAPGRNVFGGLRVRREFR